MIKPNPFTPQSGWEPRILGGRKKEIGSFARALDKAKQGKQEHIVVLGEWGVGKTSLLKQFKKIAQGKGFLSSLCSITKFSEKSSTAEGIKIIVEEITLGFSRISLEDLDVDLSFAKGKKRISLSPQTQLAKFLLDTWKRLKTPLAVVLFDDVQNFISIAAVIDILRSVLSKEEIIENTKYLFVLSSTPEGWAAFIDKHDPIGRFFRKREFIENLTKDDTFKLIDHTLRGSGVSFKEGIKDKIYSFTQGHPYELQLLSSHLYEAQLEGEVSSAFWEAAFNNTLKELGADYFESLLRRASEREREMLALLAERKEALSIGDIRKIVISERRLKGFPIANIKNFLYRLENKGILRRSPEGQFAILDLMFAEFIKRNLAKD